MLNTQNKTESQTEQIGRFEIIQSLGRGAQGEVFLAHDPQLDRKVAIKTLLASSASDLDSLLQEARMVSKLQHPHIVTLFDVGEHEQVPYLVYAYVPGQTLAQQIKKESTLPLSMAAQMVCSILDAIQYAHEQKILHLDLKPSNIMVSSSGQALVMDFGIAQTFTQASTPSEHLIGTPQYIAPERILGEAPTPSSDIFSIGMMLYEMVTGTPAASGTNVLEVLHKNANEESESPSARNINIDAQLETIILKSLAKRPIDRYASAFAMKEALQTYLNPVVEEFNHNSSGAKNSTFEFLLRRMRTKGDFPALSSTLSEINKVVDDENARTHALTKSILQDFSLTNKLLKLVNTAIYSQFGGKINTISKAVSILGFESVRSIAMTLILFDFLQNKAQAAQLKDDVLAAFFSGIIAAHVSTSGNIRDAEEAMICSMFRNLGKMLASLYLFEESQEIARLVEQGEVEEKAAFKVLGISYNDLGTGIAKSWNFPPRLIAGMAKLSGEKIAKPQTDLDKLAATVNLANDLCEIARNGRTEDKSKALKNLSKRYQSAIPISEHELGKALEKGLADLSARASIIKMDLAKSSMMKQINRWSSGAISSQGMAASEHGLDAHADAGESEFAATEMSMNVINQEDLSAESEAILNSGVQDVTNALVSERKLNDIVEMVLETMYRGMQFNRVIVFVKDVNTHRMVAKYGFGEEVDSIIPKFQFKLDNTQDVFHLACSKGVDLQIEDIQAANIASKIPQWFKSAVSAQSFILLPVMVKANAVGLFYADMQKANGMQINDKQHALLRTLRNQVVLAIKQR